MSDPSNSKLPFGIIVAGLGAIAGALSVLLARKESREIIRDRGTKGLEYLNQTSAKVRERTEGLVAKGREFMSGCCATADTADTTGKSAVQDEHGDKPEMH